uniref:Uncharacterized protein n=1 Tax=Arundo donax TaxID=35708 RepID=A0A0A9DQB9_ARUDO
MWYGGDRLASWIQLGHSSQNPRL